MRSAPVASVLATCLLASPAGADPNPASLPAAASQPVDHFREGVVLFDAADFPRAIAELEAAYTAGPHPPILYALAQSYRMSGDCRQALRLYRTFLASGPPPLQARLVEQDVDLCEAALSATTAGSRGALLPDELSDERGRVPPNDVDWLAVLPDVAASSPPGDERPWYRDPVGDVLAGAGVVGLVVGTGLLVSAAGDAAAAPSAPSLGAFEGDLASTHDAQVGATVAFVAGGALVTAGVVRFVERSSRRARPDVWTAASPARGGGALRVGGRF